MDRSPGAAKRAGERDEGEEENEGPRRSPSPLGTLTGPSGPQPKIICAVSSEGGRERGKKDTPKLHGTDDEMMKLSIKIKKDQLPETL